MGKFLKTVAVVTVFSVSEKCLGFLYRIFLSRTIGTEGIGLYQVSLSVFAFFYTLCCSGIPITVSRLMTKYKAENDKKKERMVITAGLGASLFFAVITCVIFYVFHNEFNFLFTDNRCVKIFYVLLPGLIFTSVYSVLRGVFWGNKDFLPYSVIELLEELCMIIVGILTVSLADGVYDGAYRAGFAVLISYIFSFSLATAVFFIRKGKLANPLPELKPLLISSTPVTAMRTASTLAVSLVSVILPMQLVAAGLTETEAMSVFGAAVGQAMPLLFIPSTLIGSFTLVLIPEIAENYYKGDTKGLKENIEKSLKLNVIVACLFIPVYCVCGEEIGILLFNSHECGKYLSASAVLMFFISVSNLSTSVLNSIGLETRTLIYYIIGGVFMLLSIWLLPFVVGIYSLLIGFSFVYGLTTVLNLRLISKKCKDKPKYLRFMGFSLLALLPVTVMGIMLKKILLPYLGTGLTLISVGLLLTLFHVFIYIGFNYLDVGFFKYTAMKVFNKKKKGSYT